ncbi:MAG: hypothetical protein GX217_05645 [Clostridiaceae bacterium]|nr:hypothetical protein [Clostridiaceae bacterium]
MEIVSASDSAHGTLEIKVQVDQEEVQATKLSEVTSKTEESSGYYSWPTLILLSAGGLILLARKKSIPQETD